MQNGSLAQSRGRNPGFGNAGKAPWVGAASILGDSPDSHSQTVRWRRNPLLALGCVRQVPSKLASDDDILLLCTVEAIEASRGAPQATAKLALIRHAGTVAGRSNTRAQTSSAKLSRPQGACFRNAHATASAEATSDESTNERSGE